MLRPAPPADTDARLRIADASGLSTPDERAEVREMLAAHVAGDLGPDHVWLTDDGGPAAVA